jgi:hypothetical protein
VIVDLDRGAVPFGAGGFEVADQFALLGVDTDHGQSATLEAGSQRGDDFELLVALDTGTGSKRLVIDAQRVVHALE